MNDLDCVWDNLTDLGLESNPLDLQEFITTFIKLKVLANHQQTEADKEERISHLKDQLDQISKELIAEKKMNQD